MSATPYFFLEAYDPKDGKFKLNALYVWNYNHDKLVPSDLWPYNGTHELFEELSDYEAIPEVQIGIPVDVCGEIKNRYEPFEKENSMGYRVDPSWIWLRDLKSCLMGSRKKTVRRVVRPLVDRANAFIETLDDFDGSISRNARIVFWVV